MRRGKKALLLLALLLVVGLALWGNRPWREQRELEKEILTLLNERREERGLPLLEEDKALYKAARTRAKEQTKLGELSHQRPDGRSFETALEEGDFTFAAENLAYLKGVGQDAAFWLDGWEASPGHCRNLYDRHMTRGAVVVLCREDEYYAVQLFAGD